MSFFFLCTKEDGRFVHSFFQYPVETFMIPEFNPNPSPQRPLSMSSNVTSPQFLITARDGDSILSLGREEQGCCSSISPCCSRFQVTLFPSRITQWPSAHQDWGPQGSGAAHWQEERSASTQCHVHFPSAKRSCSAPPLRSPRLASH